MEVLWEVVGPRFQDPHGHGPDKAAGPATSEWRLDSTIPILDTILHPIILYQKNINTNTKTILHHLILYRLYQNT